MEAFSTALSEIDEKAARLEMSSRAEDKQLLSGLRQKRDALRRRIAQENERRVGMLAKLDKEAALRDVETAAGQVNTEPANEQPGTAYSAKTTARSIVRDNKGGYFA